VSRPEVSCRPYGPRDEAECLQLFDSNCPAAFAAGERDDYASYLRSVPDYIVYVRDDTIAGAFGMSEDRGRARLRWILVHPRWQGSGLGSEMMRAVVRSAVTRGARVLDIAASQVSEPFFARFGARVIRRIEDGWGSGMHRVDMELDLTAAAL